METPEEKLKIKAAVRLSLEHDRQKLLIRQPFVGSILMRLELIPLFDSRIPSAATDGGHIFVSCRFYQQLTAEERLFVLAHEVWHIVLLHFKRQQNRDRDLFNRAADLEIHFVLLEQRFAEPFILPHNPRWCGKSAEEIYELLKTEDPSKWMKGKDSAHIKGIRPDGGMDSHLSDEDVKESLSAENVEEYDPDFSPVMPSSTAEQIRRNVIQSAQRTERLGGAMPGTVKGLLDKLRNPEIRWQELLKQFVTSVFGGERHWLPPARRYIHAGLYLPSRRDKILRATVAIDTSASTSSLLTQFFGELNGILHSFGNYELTLIQCDAAIQKVEMFSGTSPLPPNYKWKVSGGGGTSMRPVFDYIRKKGDTPNLLIYLTDGFGPAPKTAPSYPVMWVLSSGGRKPALWGRAVKLK